MTTDQFCFYLQNRLIQTCQTGGEQYSDTSPLVFPGLGGESCFHLNTQKSKLVKQFYKIIAGGVLDRRQRSAGGNTTKRFFLGPK
jgi:hypothetical protein